MKKTIGKNPVFDYNAVTELACQLWQKQGCCFGQFVMCLHQATEQLLEANQIGIKHVKRGPKRRNLPAKGRTIPKSSGVDKKVRMRGRVSELGKGL